MSNIIHNIKQKVWWLILETNTIITYLACIFFLFIIGRIFILPLKSILKLIGNSIIGGILIFIINIIGNIFNFHIGLNIGTAIVVGILGIPRSNSFNIFEIFIMSPLGHYKKTVEICNNVLYNKQRILKL